MAFCFQTTGWRNLVIKQAFFPVLPKTPKKQHISARSRPF
jgi:hypothetical protein